MASSSNNYQPDPKSIEILENSQVSVKKKDRLNRNSFAMLNGLASVDLKENITSLKDLCKEETATPDFEVASQFIANQLPLNVEVYEGISNLVDRSVDKIKKKRDVVNQIKKF